MEDRVMHIKYRSISIDGVRVFYREAGSADGPVVLLLHGFPTSSHMFRDLIPQLPSRYRIIAPDLPGFGQTVTPARGEFDYTFDKLAQVIGDFVEALRLEHYALYVFDYGAPVGYRLALAHPERVTAIVSQNGNAYLDGFSDAWDAFQAYWRAPSAQTREACRVALAPETIRSFQYLHGADAAL